MAKGKRSSRFTNEYSLPDFEYKEIMGMTNEEIISKAASEYANWMASEKLKKEDPELSSVASQIKALEDDIKDCQEYQDLKQKLDEKVEELADESLASYKERKKNLLEPYQEDIKRFKNTFKAAMDEINRRKREGSLVVEGKIV